MSTSSRGSDALVLNGRFSSSPITQVTLFSKSPVFTISLTNHGTSEWTRRRARVGLRHLVAVDLGGHRRRQLDHEERGSVDRRRVAGAVLDLGRARGLVRDLEPGPRRLLLEFEHDDCGAAVGLGVLGYARQVHRLPGSRSPGSYARRGLRRAAAMHSGMSCIEGGDGRRRRRGRVRGGRLAVPRGAAAPCQDEGEKSAVASRVTITTYLLAPVGARSPPGSSAVDLDHLRAAALTADHLHGAARNVELSSARSLHERLVRAPALRGAATRARQPSPWRPTSSLRLAPGDTVTLIRATTRSGLARAPRRPRCTRRPRRRRARSRSSTPPRGRAS